MQDISAFVALVLENPDRFMGKRIDVASGRQIDYVQQPIAEVYKMSPDAAKMSEWFDAVGYSADIETLRRDYPVTGWHTFQEWAEAQDWSILNPEGAKTNAA